MATRTLQESILGHGPGLLCVFAVVALAYGVQCVFTTAALGLGTTAFLLGLSISSAWRIPSVFEQGLQVATKPLLRLAIVLLGLQMTVDGLLDLGWPVLIGICGVVVGTLAVTVGFARLIRAEAGLATLIAVGSAICGASAIMAANQVVRRNEGQVAYAVACVTVFGTLSVLALPALGRYFGMGHEVYAIWVGASVHEVAQVVAASDCGDIEVSATAIAVKLARVMMLPIVIWILVRIQASSGMAGVARASSKVPNFVYGYLGCAAIASTGLVPVDVLNAAKGLTGLLLATSLAAIGLMTNLRMVDRNGWRPFAVAALAWIVVSGMGFLAAYLA